MTTPSDLAAALHAARSQRLDFSPVRIDGRVLSEEEAYGVQEDLLKRLQRGNPAGIAGYKIGLTSRAMQDMCGLHAPIYGAVLADLVHRAPATLELGRYARLGLEFEIALLIGEDVTDPPATWQEMSRWVEAAAPALELIDDRHADYRELDGPSIVADNAWNAGVVLGPWQPLPPDLAGRHASISCEAHRVDEGEVGDALEHPLASAHWLAASLLRRGRVLRKGMIVMTGSIMRTRFASPGERWRYEVKGLGTIDVDFG